MPVARFPAPGDATAGRQDAGLAQYNDAFADFVARPQGVLARSRNSDPLHLQALSTAIAEGQAHIRELNEKVVKTRDPAVLLRVTEALADNSLRNELLSKVVGKTVSGIDQLTKLS